MKMEITKRGAKGKIRIGKKRYPRPVPDSTEGAGLLARALRSKKRKTNRA